MNTGSVTQTRHYAELNSVQSAGWGGGNFNQFKIQSQDFYKPTVWFFFFKEFASVLQIFLSQIK